MKTLILTLTILLLNGCSQKAPHKCPPEKPCSFPTFKTYKYPPSNPLTKPILHKDGNCTIPFSDFKELYSNNKYLRKQLWRANMTFIKANEEYSDGKN